MQADYERLSETLMKIYVRSHVESETLLESRSLKSLSFLTEQIDPKDVEDQTKVVKQDLTKIMKLLPADKAKALIMELDKLIKAIPDGAKISSIISAPDFSGDKESQELAKKYDKSVMLATNGAASVVNAINSLAKAIKPFTGNLSDDELKLSIGELAEKATSDSEFKNKFVEKSKLEAGLAKVFIPAADVKNSFQRGAKAVRDTAGSVQSKSGLGKLFQKASAFLGGFFTAPPTKLYPKLFEAFKAFLLTVTPDEIAKLADQMKVQGNKFVLKTSENAAGTTSSVTAAAAGAEVSASGQSTPKKVKADDLEKAIAGKFPGAAKAIIAALKKDEKTRDLLEGRLFKENGMPNLRFILSEAVTYDDILNVIKNADPAFSKKPEKAEQYAAKVTKYLKTNGADVDDKGAPEIKEDEDEEAPADAAAATAAADQAGQLAVASAEKTTMGKAIHKALIDYLQPYVDRKSLSNKAREALISSVEKELNSSLDKKADELANFSADGFKDVLANWYNSLDDKMKDRLGGSKKGSEKAMKAAAKNIDDIVKKNFKVEENKKKQNDLIVERWQRLAGIK